MKIQTLIEKLAHLLTKSNRKRIILDREEKQVYLERYYLIFKERHRYCPFNILLHKICLSDEEGLHDHPWPWASLILTGGYWEHTPEGKFWRKPGSFRIRSATDLHRLELDPSKGPVWTLFLVGKRGREWGFLDPIKGWVHYEEYLEECKAKSTAVDTTAISHERAS